jgi:hypothetical protein
MTDKKLSSIALVILLTLSMAAVFTVSPVLAAQPYIAMKPEHIINNSPSVGQTFSFWVNVSSTIGFTAYQYYIFWDRTYINATGITYTPPASFTFPAGIGLKWDFNTTHGTVQRGDMDPNLATITGTYTVAKIDFEIIKVPKAPLDPDALIKIDLDDGNTILSDAIGNPIAIYVYDGDVFLKALMAAPPTIYVEYPHPQATVAFPSAPDYTKGNATGLGVQFTVDVKIKDVVAEHGLWGWEFMMLYNTTLLDTINVTEGSFLKSFAGSPPNGTFFIAKFDGMFDPAHINTTYEQEGKIHVACLLYGDHTIPVGGGTLATITFNATYQTTGDEPIAWCWLDIFNKTALADSEDWPGPPPGSIPHNSMNGAYGAPTEITEPRYIDSYTGAYRKYGNYNTTFTGRDIIKGRHENADVYAPQDWVTIYALVTYFDDPVQNKPVQFEIYPRDKYTGEPRELEGFPLYRVALTDENGIATIEFRIPWPCDDYTRVLGGWYVYQSVDIACKKVVDEEWFEVAWPIWLTKVMVQPIVYKYPTCTQYANVTFVYENHALTALPAYFTVVLYDHEMVPIGMAIVDRRQDKVPGSVWCSPYVENESVSIHIPKWAFIGKPYLVPGDSYWPYPAVFVNAYTDRCSDCGLPYCPEAVAYFEIKAQA